MDIDKFKKQVEDPEKSQQQLENMYKNALSKGKPGYANLVSEQLNKRFPGWDRPKGKRGGSRPTVAYFRSQEKEFPSGKEAFVWMVEKFIKEYPQVFNEINWETVFVAQGKKRLYFARSPEKLFFGSPHLAEDSNNYVRLTNGWFANANLSNDQKFDVLSRFAAVAKLSYGTDWTWQVLA